jgi:hypothetical protein
VVEAEAEKISHLVMRQGKDTGESSQAYEPSAPGRRTERSGGAEEESTEKDLQGSCRQGLGKEELTMVK